MKTARTLFLGLLLFLNGMPVTVFAQAAPQIFALPDAVAGERYRASVATVLSDTYHLKLESDGQTPIYRWIAAPGELPPGLLIRPNGSIVGVPRLARAEPYRFKLNVLDTSSPRSEPLTLDFTMTISAPRVRLAHINTPRLVATDGVATTVSTNAELAKERKDSLPSSDDQTLAGRNRVWTAENIYASMLRKNSDANTALRSDEAPFPAAPVAVANCTTVCDPTPAPDPKNDFIIDAATGATTGRTKFSRADRTRIIIKNKNPFLYEYRLTIEEKAVEEPGLAAFLDLLPIGKGTFDTAHASDKNAATSALAALKTPTANALAPACPLLEGLLTSENKLATSETTLKTTLDALTNAFNSTQDEYNKGKVALTAPGAQCPGLCSDANTLLTTLRGYLAASKPPFEQFTTDAAKFTERANALHTNVADLQENSAACAAPITNARLPQLADHYIEVATTLQKGLDKLNEGRKGLDNAAKSIEKVFVTANSFYEVRETGDFDVPTNVNIKLERKQVAQENAEFGKVIETKLNFGGGARFTLAGGLVASLLERPEYERVSTVVSGQVVNIVGLKRTSSSRVLPVIMLHTRLYDTRRNFIDGIHFSVGLTAKPNSEGTSAEFLIGPSLSFAEGRMFFTAGGYVGKKQELQGSFTVGSQIPKDFADELPISEHYVWKPGFALTYKIK
jgi:hypothetical protein